MIALFTRVSGEPGPGQLSQDCGAETTVQVLMISNQMNPEGHAGFREAFSEMQRLHELGGSTCVAPNATAAALGEHAARRELVQIGERVRPEVVLVSSPNGFGHDHDWIERFLRSCGDPFVIYWEGDAWHRWAKPVNQSMRGWLAVADVVFTHARRPHISLFGRYGARDVRFIPPTYCQVVFSEAERFEPPRQMPLPYDVVSIGNRLAHWGVVSRVPGAAGRARLVRALQRRPDLRLAIYGSGWSGRGARGPLPFSEQTAALRQGLVSANWDHFPGHESYTSNRLPISLLAGRAHVTTRHPGLDWVPDEAAGLFLEQTPSAVLNRTRELVAAPIEESLRLGAAGHQWVRERLSNREAARFMIGAFDRRFLEGLPYEPWHRFVAEWPD